jgi:hypothetical protein
MFAARQRVGYWVAQLRESRIWLFFPQLAIEENHSFVSRLPKIAQTDLFLTTHANGRQLAGPAEMGQFA